MFCRLLGINLPASRNGRIGSPIPFPAAFSGVPSALPPLGNTVPARREGGVEAAAGPRQHGSMGREGERVGRVSIRAKKDSNQLESKNLERKRALFRGAVSFGIFVFSVVVLQLVFLDL